MRFSPTALLSRLRRDKVQDPFGGDDDNFGGESGFTLSGPKLAFAASGLLFVLLIGGVTAIVVTGEAPDKPPPMMGSLADLEVVEETEPATAAPDATPSNTIAATDRSTERRPWLNPPASSSEAAPRPSMSESATKSETPAEETFSERPAEAPTATTPDETETAPSLAETAEAATADASETVVDTDILNEPSLADPGPAPGAPGLFDVEDIDYAPDLAGGRPRLVEPTLPPIHRQAVTAPPPRYANLANIRNDASRTASSATASKIAVVVEGLGLSKAATETAIIKLPPPVTLAFSPYARNLKNGWIWPESTATKY